MPIATLWGLVVSLALLALGMAYKLAEVGHSLTKSKEDGDTLRKNLVTLEDDKKKEAASFRTEIDALKDDFNKTISSIKETHQRESEELRNRIADLTKPIHKEPPYKIRYFDDANFRWKYKLFPSNYFEVDENPFCLQHDLQFVSDDTHLFCPTVNECGCKLPYKHYNQYFKQVESFIDREVRNSCKEITMESFT